MACPWYSVCPLRRWERLGRLDEVWAQTYCKTADHWRNCRRYQFEEKGIAHPDDMMPDGRIDESCRAEGP